MIGVLRPASIGKALNFAKDAGLDFYVPYYLFYID